MLLTATITNKVMGSKNLFADLNFFVEDNEKIGIVGRNGIGKTTLFNVLDGSDGEFEGTINMKKGLQLISTRQEHHDNGSLSTLDYVVQNLPDYRELKAIIDTYPATMGNSMRKINIYSEALDRFSSLGYYDIEPKILNSLDSYQISADRAREPFKSLSGGQKRFVELVRVQYSLPNLALLDEPTNHMDYIAKAAFIEWLKGVRHACLVITHDRDVLATVDRILEIKDGKCISYKGNYESYLKQNTANTTNQLQGYEIAQRTIANIKKQIEYARAKKPSWSGTADKKNPFVVMEERLRRELHKLETENQKPSFWIDQESAEQLRPKVTAHYEKYKAKNIRIGKSDQKERDTSLLSVENLQLGYTTPLFRPVSFSLQPGQRLHIVGRNGAGKTTLVKAINEAAAGRQPSTLQSGKIIPGLHLRFNQYEQEIDESLLDLPLAAAIETIHNLFDVAISREQIMRHMGDYLFDPKIDANVQVRNLSGGQKARLQLIRMLVNKPNLLVLDEPTNHLDLPSIEELETALKVYPGAIIYISHDSYFARNLGGESLLIKA